VTAPRPIRYRRRHLGASIPPSDIRDSPDMRLAMADIEQALTGQSGLYDTVLERELAKLAGRVGAAERYLPPDTDPGLRSVFGQPAPIAAILGDWQPDGTFLPGLAGLTDQECRAYDLAISGFEPAAIARFMERKRSSRFGTAALSIETVDSHLGRARKKLRLLFGVGDTADV
jgi:hypothetical protein